MFMITDGRDSQHRARVIAGRVSLSCVVAFLAIAPARTGRAAQEKTASPDISGFWELNFDSRRVPPASLLPAVTRTKIDARARKDAYAIRWCNLLGVPFVMDSGRPLDIRQGATAIIIVPENASAPRYLYTNRTRHVSEEIFDPSTNGDSIAHWAEDTLIVDTVGFHGERGITAIPGGGFRTDTSHLVERYRLLSDGAVLSVTFTWTDPTVFRMPHTYEYRYHRLPPTYEPRQWLPCDPYDEERAKFLDPPTPVKPTGRAKE
jgi:hypothetical protein